MIYWAISFLIGVTGGYYSLRYDAILKAALWAMILPAWTLFTMFWKVVWCVNLTLGEVARHYIEAFNNADPHLHYAIIFCPFFFLTTRILTYVYETASPDPERVRESRAELKNRVHEFYDWDAEKLGKK